MKIDAQELQRILYNLAVMPAFNTTTNKAVAKEILSRGWFICQGYMRKPKAKHIGLGVYEISSTPYNP